MNHVQQLERVIAIVTGNTLSSDEMEDVIAVCEQDFDDPQGFIRAWEQEEGPLQVSVSNPRGSILQYNLVNHEHCSWAFATGYDTEEIHACLQDMLSGPTLPDYTNYLDYGGHRPNDIGSYAFWLNTELQECRPDLVAFAFVYDTIDDEGAMVVFTIDREDAPAFEQLCPQLGLYAGPLSAVAALWSENQGRSLQQDAATHHQPSGFMLPASLPVAAQMQSA